MTATTIFLRRTYDEAMQLLLEARAAFSGELRPTTVADEPPAVSLRVSTESFRVTARLTQIMAWLMAQRAVEAGEITQAEAVSDRYGLDRTAGHLAEPLGPEGLALPPLLQALLERSRLLYLRIVRLDDLVRRDLDRQPAPG